MTPDWFAHLLKWMFMAMWFLIMFDGLGRL